MILTTTNKIEGKTVNKYLGIVSSTAYSTMYVTKNMSFSDIFKSAKYTEAYEKKLEETKESAFQKLKENAQNLKANAVIGITLDIEYMANTSYCIVSLAGTAVVAV